ncbi:helix-turn-helix transcriptional regulator [Gilvimarinus agarilyticus]|uniref:helix-turn-helix transcriptional regulator n=1 Tax=Gilvimarinus sp. 2_MG-2023 TaxID=3062666 RepID=UPI001C081B43|nr:helix-turn-helix transcriptional regulator [Gilvimarinus sp. 2_MG-2023]MBU2886356.1 helix-turn-helix transcriptional regulator [Gilvimarinus agarilyticus]MDO6571035.1 helix-turn-helix transcriptional regulator [Gilvimarinus sp. 2_MG-2023]
MKKSNIYCEPFCIRQGQNFEVHHVVYNHNDPYSCFMHFHEVHELIVFQEIEGNFFYNQGQSQLHDYDLVFTPALETHDFELTERPKSWYIVQFLPSVLEDSQLGGAADFFRYGMHLRPSAEARAQIAQVTAWLLEAYQRDPFSEKSQLLLGLLLSCVVEGAVPVQAPHTQPLQRAAGFERLTPVINLFRHQRYVELSLNEAAELCHLSPSYFSRLFKSVFRYSYSEYSIRHRLYSAARLLAQSEHSITDIAYELGFSSPSHFISLFKKQFGVTPKKYHDQVVVKS